VGEFMNLTIQKGELENLIEIWELGPTCVEVTTKDRQHFRITAARNIRSGATPKYFAHYEQLYKLTINGKEHEVWGATTFPWQDGETVEKCIGPALMWVNEQYADEHR
jgi:hypothetical protein